ncbi:hypothetical protein HK405_007060 [Cladochytrium tenue]|nr:hypothetical protein HK405_007060 [Cladochytrium tenue]
MSRLPSAVHALLLLLVLSCTGTFHPGVEATGRLVVSGSGTAADPYKVKPPLTDKNACWYKNWKALGADSKLLQWDPSDASKKRSTVCNAAARATCQAKGKFPDGSTAWSCDEFPPASSAGGGAAAGASWQCIPAEANSSGGSYVSAYETDAWIQLDFSDNPDAKLTPNMSQKQPSHFRAMDAEASVRDAHEDECDARAAVRDAHEDECDARAAVRDAPAAVSTAQAGVCDANAAVSKAQQWLDKWMDSNLPEGQIYMEFMEMLRTRNTALKESEEALKEANGSGTLIDDQR